MSRFLKIFLITAAAVFVCFVAGIVFLLHLAFEHNAGLRFADLGYRAVSQGKDKQAISYFDSALKKPLGDFPLSYVYLNRGTAYNHECRLAEAIHDHTEALRLNPKLTFAYELRAWAYEQDGETNKALADLNQLLGQPSNSYYGYYTRGMIYYSRANFDGALN